MKSKEETREYRRQYYLTHKKEFKKRQRRYKKAGKTVLWAKTYVERNRAKVREAQNRFRNTLRQKTFEALGGKCIVCGESNKRWLHTDRIKGGRHTNNARWVYNHRDEFQILCANHHNEKTVYGEFL